MNLNKNQIRKLKIWPQKKWKKIMFVTLLVLMIVGVPTIAFFEYSVYAETVSPLEVKNSSGSKNALVIYHPGLTTFSHDIAYALANRLAHNGWRVEITTASYQSPTNIDNYDLLVLEWPIYDFNPGPTLTNYIHRVGDFQDKDTVIVAIGGGINPFNAQNGMKQIIQETNGHVRTLVTIFRGGNFTDKADQAIANILP